MCFSLILVRNYKSKERPKQADLEWFFSLEDDTDTSQRDDIMHKGGGKRKGGNGGGKKKKLSSKQIKTEFRIMTRHISKNVCLESSFASEITQKLDILIFSIFYKFFFFSILTNFWVSG